MASQYGLILRIWPPQYGLILWPHNMAQGDPQHSIEAPRNPEGLPEIHRSPKRPTRVLRGPQ